MATTCFLYYDCFCSVEKNHHLHRGLITLFPQLLAFHYLKKSLNGNNSIQDISGKLKKYLTYSLSSTPETPPDTGIRGKNALISSRKAGHAVPIPFLTFGLRVVTIVVAQGLSVTIIFLFLSLSNPMLFSWRILLLRFRRFSVCDR